MKPIIKWAGGKTQLLNELLPMIPEDFKTYYEPFFGGGALYFSLLPEKAIVNDYNFQLINMYKIVRDNPKKLMKALDKLEDKHSEFEFYVERKKFNDNINKKNPSISQASRFIYLNKSDFNGLYRLNSCGEFNSPSGHKKKVISYNEENLLEVSKQLNKNIKLKSGDFAKACKTCKKGDFVFFDSPYYKTFDNYQAGGFTYGDHQRLAELFKELSQKGVYCMLTNSNEKMIKKFYKDFNIKEVNVKRMINCDGTKRTGSEVIITNY